MVIMSKWNGVKCSKERRMELVDTALNGISKNRESDYFFCSIGDSMGLALRIEDGPYKSIEVFDLKVRHRGTIYEEDEP